MKFNRDELKNRIAELPTQGQAFFALLCAERLRACCWAFSKKENWDLSKYYEGCDLLFNHLAYNAALTESQIANMIDEIDKCVPVSDEFGGDFLQVQAQSGMVALLYAFETLRKADPENGVYAAYAVIDGVDNYKAFIAETLTGDMEIAEEYALMDRELTWQLESTSALKSFTEAESAKYVSLRTSNMEYAVPVSIWNEGQS